MTQADLLLENPVKLPFLLNVELPLKAFFFIVPFLFLITHAYILAHLVLLADKAKRFDLQLREQITTQGEGSGSDEGKEVADIRQGVRRQLPSNIFVQFIAGPDDIRGSWLGVLLKTIAWTSLVIGPVLLLLLLQIQFLPYHYGPITWTHRLVLLADLLLVWWLWRKILPGRRNFYPWMPAVGIVSTLAALIFSWVVATFPTEWQEDHLPSVSSIRAVHEWLFAGPVDDITRRRKSFFSSTLVLPGFDIYEALKMDDPKKVAWKERLIDLRGRHLEHSVFDGANLPKVDLSGAYLEHASFNGARLQGALLASAKLQGASLFWTELQSASLPLAQLQGATLFFTGLQGASLQGAQLQGAFLVGAQLSGATLDGAQLQGTYLGVSNFSGASLVSAQLQGAALVSSQLWGASLERAQLQGAFLVSGFAATDMRQAFLWRAYGEPDYVWEVLASELTWGPQFLDKSDKPTPWTQDKYQALRKMMVRDVPPDKYQTDALTRIEALDCEKEKFALTDQISVDLASCEPRADPLVEKLGKASVDNTTYIKFLATVLGDAVCEGKDITKSVAAAARVMSEMEQGKVSRFAAAGLYRPWAHPEIGSIHILRGLLANGRFKASGAEAPALADRILSRDCPVSAALTEHDRAKLRAFQTSPDQVPTKK